MLRRHPSASRDYQSVGNQVYEQRETSKYDLRSTREPGRVNHRLNVVVDKSSSVPRLTAEPAKGVLEWRQRTNPARELDENSPDCGGNMEHRDPLPAEHQQSTQYDEENECEVNGQYEICESAVDQLAAG